MNVGFRPVIGPVLSEIQPANAPIQGTHADPTSATKDAPFVNSLGMKFVTVPILGGPTNGQRVLFSIWDTRVQDYDAFAKETKRDWPKPGHPQGPTHPVTALSWEDAQAFCHWLTERERRAGAIGPNDWYRLPTDHEWSCAAGIGSREDPTELPIQKNRKISDVFPWGDSWPPPKGAGNYAGEELRPAIAKGKYHTKDAISGYDDGFVETSPVGSFNANSFGLFDLGGNVWQWCDDWYDKDQAERVLRGGSWGNYERFFLISSCRAHDLPTTRTGPYGFRSVLERQK
jgi:formylglycine-generating enzyme required for sulfatase activity